jgi:hypothetical protein
MRYLCEVSAATRGRARESEEESDKSNTTPRASFVGEGYLEAKQQNLECFVIY